MHLITENEIIEHWNYSKGMMVSIDCTTFNHEKFIKDALNGFIIQQTDFPFEILVYDDASTDNTVDIIRAYEVKYPQIIKSIYQNENQYSKGGSISARFQFPRARGKYIAICEGDDYWTDPLKLQKQVDFMEDNARCGLLYTEFDRLTQTTGLIERSLFSNTLGIKENSFEEFLINAWFIATCTWMFRSAFLKVIQPNLSKNFVIGDLVILLTIASVSNICYLSDVTATYRVLEKSASHLTNLSDRKKFSKGVLDIQLFFANENKVSDDIMLKIYEAYYQRTFITACVNGDKELKTKAYLFWKENGTLNVKTKLIYYLSMNKYLFNFSMKVSKFVKQINNF